MCKSWQFSNFADFSLSKRVCLQFEEWNIKMSQSTFKGIRVMNFLINQCYLVSIVKPKIFFEFLNLESILKSALNSLYLKIFCHYCLKKVVQKVPQITWQKQQNSVRKSQKSFDKFKRFQEIMALASARGKLIGVIGDEVSLKIQKIFSLDLESYISCYFF